jgi:hypothetical protein
MSTEIVTETIDLANDIAQEPIDTQQKEQKIDLGADIEKVEPEIPEKVEPEIPEKYELQYPEGFEVHESVSLALQDVFKKSKMTQDQAQTFAQEIVNIQNVMFDEQKKNVNTIYEGWRTELSQNPNFSGQEYKTSVSHIQSAVKHIVENTDENYGSKIKEIIYAQSESNPGGQGLINNPAIAEMLRIVGKTLSQDSAILGKPSARPKSLAEQFYGRG